MAAQNSMSLQRGTVNAQIYGNDILNTYVRIYAGEIGDVFLLQDDNARPHGAHIVDDYFQQETILHMEKRDQSSDLNPIKYLWDALGRHLVALNPSPQTLAELAIVLQK